MYQFLHYKFLLYSKLLKKLINQTKYYIKIVVHLPNYPQNIKVKVKHQQQLD